MTDVYSGQAVSSAHNANHETRITTLESKVFTLELAAAATVSVVKTADETVTTSTTFQNDDELSLPFASNTTYLIECMLIANVPTAADLKTCYTYTTGAGTRISTYATAPALGVTGYEGSAFWWCYRNESTSPSSNLLLGGCGTASFYKPEGILVAGSNAGTITLQWTQVASSGTNTVYKDSWLKLTPIS